MNLTCRLCNQKVVTDAIGEMVKGVHRVAHIDCLTNYTKRQAITKREYTDGMYDTERDHENEH